jgi:hypothetical protein
MNKVVYDGKPYCPDCSDCPVAELDEQGQTVTLRDPARPELGRFTMTVSQYNALLKNAQPIS